MWVTGVLSVGLSVIGAAMILMAFGPGSRVTEEQRRVLLFGGIILIALASFIPPLFLLFSQG